MFNGSSYLKYEGLGNRLVLSWLEMEIIIKPDAMDGLILYNGYKTDGMGDFIALYIDQGYVEFAIDLGTGTAIIRLLSLIIIHASDLLLYNRLQVNSLNTNGQIMQPTRKLSSIRALVFGIHKLGSVRQTDRTERQADKQTDKQTNRQTGQTDKQTDRTDQGPYRYQASSFL